MDCQLAHRLIDEYLTEAPASLVADAVESLSGDALLHMLHTHHGCAASCMVLAYGTAKDRKKAVRALKGHVPAAMQDEWGHLAILTALSVVDDTSMLKKFVVAEIQVHNDLIIFSSYYYREINKNSPVKTMCRRAVLLLVMICRFERVEFSSEAQNVSEGYFFLFKSQKIIFFRLPKKTEYSNSHSCVHSTIHHFAERC